MTPTPQLFEAVSVERELPDTNCPVAIIQDDSSPFDSYFDGKNFIGDEGVIYTPSYWLRPVSIADEVSDEEIENMMNAKLGKREVMSEREFLYAKITGQLVRDKLAHTIAWLKSQIEHWQLESHKSNLKCASFEKQLAAEKEKTMEICIEGFKHYRSLTETGKNHPFDQTAMLYAIEQYSLYLSQQNKNEGK